MDLRTTSSPHSSEAPGFRSITIDCDGIPVPGGSYQTNGFPEVGSGGIVSGGDSLPSSPRENNIQYQWREAGGGALGSAVFDGRFEPDMQLQDFRLSSINLIDMVSITTWSTQNVCAELRTAEVKVLLVKNIRGRALIIYK